MREREQERERETAGAREMFRKGELFGGFYELLNLVRVI